MDWFSVCGKYGKINDKKNTISHSGMGYDNTCYGNLTILSQDNKSYYWKFKINKQLQSGDISIGIDQDKCKWINTSFYYQIGTMNYSYSSNARKYNSSKVEEYGINYKTGDIVEMALIFRSNLLFGVLAYILNGNKLGVAYSNVKRGDDIKYKMAIRTFMDSDSVSLLSFNTNDTNEHKYDDDDDDIAENKANDDKPNSIMDIIQSNLNDTLQQQMQYMQVRCITFYINTFTFIMIFIHTIYLD